LALGVCQFRLGNSLVSFGVRFTPVLYLAARGDAVGMKNSRSKSTEAEGQNQKPPRWQLTTREETGMRGSSWRVFFFPNLPCRCEFPVQGVGASPGSGNFRLRGWHEASCGIRLEEYAIFLGARGRWEGSRIGTYSRQAKGGGAFQQEGATVMRLQYHDGRQAVRGAVFFGNGHCDWMTAIRESKKRYDS